MDDYDDMSTYSHSDDETDTTIGISEDDDIVGMCRVWGMFVEKSQQAFDMAKEYIGIKNVIGCTLLFASVIYNHYVKEMVDIYDVNIVDNNGFTPMHYAIMTCNSEAVGYLLDKTQPGTLDVNGTSYIHYAVNHGNIDILNKLLTICPYNIDINKRTPLHHACICGREEMANILISKKYDIEAADVHGMTAYMYAIQTFDQEAFIKTFLFFNINKKNKDGETPLHIATKHGKLKIVQELHNRGAFITIDSEGNTPIAYNSTIYTTY